MFPFRLGSEPHVAHRVGVSQVVGMDDAPRIAGSEQRHHAKNTELAPSREPK